MHCKICRHPQLRIAIDAALKLEKPFRLIAQASGISATSVFRHAKNCKILSDLQGASPEGLTAGRTAIALDADGTFTARSYSPLHNRKFVFYTVGERTPDFHGADVVVVRFVVRFRQHLVRNPSALEPDRSSGNVSAGITTL